MAGIRGANPIWSEVDLQGKLFDDTFYLFVLENTIPYIPAPVYHDPDLQIAWTNPIRFLGNGTLPVDIFFEPGKAYRLEFRQHIGSGSPSQQDPLIYEVNDYIAGDSGSTPVDTVSFATSNQITNPQFVLMSLQNPVTIAGTDPSPIELAPGWTLLVSGTGSVTITRVALNDANANPSNASYALRLTLSGWTAESVILRQRFQQNGMLWANKYVSSTLTARLTGISDYINATLVDSNNSVLGFLLPPTAINESWNNYSGYAQLPATSNPNTPPSAYIDYLLHLPSNIDIYLTSFQVVAQDLPVQPTFEQDSVNRQLDHTYNAAYPIVPVGGLIDFAGFVVPQHYYLCDGSAKNRVRDYLLFNAITTTETVTLTNGVNTFTVVSNADYHIGMALEGTGIAASTTITNIVGTTITMSNNATATGPSPVRFFAWGAGDGSTTFNVPNLQGLVTAGANGSLLSGVNGVGLSGGASTVTLTVGQMPTHNHPGSSAFWNLNAANVSLVGSPNISVPVYSGGSGHGNTNVSLSIANSGNNEAHPNVQPTVLVKKCIRYQ